MSFPGIGQAAGMGAPLSLSHPPATGAAAASFGSAPAAAAAAPTRPIPSFAAAPYAATGAAVPQPAPAPLPSQAATPLGQAGGGGAAIVTVAARAAAPTPAQPSVLKSVSRVATRAPQDVPPPLAFHALHAQLCEPDLDPEQGARALSTHMPVVLRALSPPPPPAKPAAGIDVRYRPGAASTEARPSASAAEAAHAAAISAHLGVSLQEASVLLRDHLCAASGEAEAIRLLAASDASLLSAAPLGAVEAFWGRERRLAHACLVKLFFFGCGIGSTRCLAAFAPLVEAHGLAVSRIVTELVLALVSAHAKSPGPDTAPLLDASQYGCVLELFFAIVHCQGLAPADALYVVRAVVAASNSAAGNRYLARRYVAGSPSQRALLDGDRCTLLLCGAIGSALSAMRWSAGGEVGGGGFECHALQARRGKLVPLDREAVGAIDSALQGAPEGTLYAEVAILRLMWGSYVAAHGAAAHGQAPGADVAGRDGVSHAMYAFRFGTGSAIRSLMLASASRATVDALLEDAVRLVYWIALHTQLVGFSPTRFPRTIVEAEEDVDLAVTILAGCGPQASEIASTQLWLHEYSDSGRWVGASSLLRMASAVFPLRFLPLVSLLAELCTDADSAIEVTATLASRMYTRTERMSGRAQDFVRKLGEDECAAVQAAADLPGQHDLNWFLRSIDLMAVGGGDGGASLVRPDSDWASSYGDTLFADATVGLLFGGDSTVTWACPWSGWQAVSLTLRSMLVLLSQPGAHREYAEPHLAELTAASLASLRLVERICHHGTAEMRQQFGDTFDSAELVCDIFLAAADPPARSGPWMPTAARATIMGVSGSCLHALTSTSTSRARSVVDRVVHSASRSNALQACVTSLGAASFPALSAVAKIANTALLGSESAPCTDPRQLHAMSDAHVTGDANGGAWRVLDFVGAIGVPNWLNLYRVDGGARKEGVAPGHWLLPAAALELFARSPGGMLDAPAAASTVMTTIVSVVGRGRRSAAHATDSFQFAALLHAVALSIAVLEHRSAALDDLMAGVQAGDHAFVDVGPLAFEKMLLEPEVVHALAVIASGASGVLLALDAAAAAAASAPRGSPCASLCLGPGDCRKSVTQLQDTAAQCLSLFMTCLFKLSQCNGRPIVQVPWPAVGHSSLGRWFGGGEAIRRGLARRIAESSNSAVGDFTATVVCCGQRAAARALFGPASGRPKPSEPGSNLSAADAREENEMLSTIVDKLQASVQSWVRAVDDPAAADVALGTVASSIASCVRTLRTAWEVHGGVWLREAWAALEVWKRLSDLLRCPVTQSQDPSLALDLNAALKGTAKVGGDELRDGAELPWTGARTAAAVDSCDAHATWREIVSDVLGVFASEVVFRSNDLAKTRPVAGEEPSGDAGATPSDAAGQRLRQEVFDDAAFAALRESFTEQWMHLFLDTSHLGVIRSNVIPFAVVDARRQTLEEMTASISADLARLLGPGAPSALSARRRRGGLWPRYGGNYAYCVRDIERSLRLAGVDAADVSALVGRVVVLNVRWSRTDAQLKVVKAFSSLTTMIVMADSVAPSQAKMLTYASPQYCGKLCRVITHGMASVSAHAIASPSTACIHVELATLLGFVSARLSPEELEQSALSAVRLGEADEALGGADVSQMSPVSKIAALIGRNAQLVRLDDDVRSVGRRARIDIMRWLLLSGARLATGTAFRTDRDVPAFGEAAMAALRAAAAEPELCSAVGVALSSVVLPSDALPQSSFGRDGVVTGVFGAIASLANVVDERSEDGDHRVAAAASLVLLVSKMASGLAGPGSTALLDMSALEHVSSGSIAALLPAGSGPVPAYSTRTLRREPAHRLWCASLSLSASLIAQVAPRLDAAAPPTGHLDGILEFAGSNASRIAGVSLDSAGDWPPATDVPTDEGAGRFRPSRHITMARVEEAELAMQTVFALADHALELRDAMPHVVAALIASPTRLVYQIYRLIRAEPVERWVRPVSDQERERSEAVRSGGDGGGAFAVGGMAGSPWALSPVASPGGGGGGGGGSVGPGPGGGPSVSGPSPRRTPQQAVQAALGRLSGRSGSSSLVPPSPGMPSTPQHQSPMSVSASALSVGPSGKYQSPLSPWGSSGGGLITGSGVFFAEEVTRSMLRGLAGALGALRRFSTRLARPLFAPTMAISAGEPSVGLLVGLQFHACNELQRGCEGERRDALLLVLENALALALSHAAAYSRRGELSAGVRDELHRRLETVVSRMRRLVPPCPSYSVVLAEGVDLFLAHLRRA